MTYRDGRVLAACETDNDDNILEATCELIEGRAVVVPGYTVQSLWTSRQDSMSYDTFDYEDGSSVTIPLGKCYPGCPEPEGTQ